MSDTEEAESKEEVEGTKDPSSADEEDDEQVTDPQIGCESCGTPESEMLVVYDRNMDKPWKGGNPYSRVCPECGSRTFTAKSYWETQDVPYVVPKGEEEPKPMYRCPYDDCDATFLGQQDECPECGGELIWEDD